MEVSLLDIQKTQQVNQYLTTVLVDDSVHQFTMKVNDTPAPMLTILGDEHFYQVLGRNYSFYRPLLEKVGTYHLNSCYAQTHAGREVDLDEELEVASIEHLLQEEISL